jgi:uncharacterized membrane protein YebE (DUF533 family)
MDDWFENSVTLDERAARIIARGMRSVAGADGILHQRELSLIASFESSLPDQDDDRGKLDDADQQTAYLRTLIMVALADGVVSDAEHARICALCEEQGIEQERVDAEIKVVKRRFLAVFAGVQVFRDAVVRVATDLGLPEAEVDALRGEA